MTREQLALGLDLFDSLDRLNEMRLKVEGEDVFGAGEKSVVVRVIDDAAARIKERLDTL